jgi:hypothetical protein
MIEMTTYLRKTKSFTAVSTYASTGCLSLGAIGLLTLILSNQDSFVIYKGTLQRRSKVGKKVFAKYWKELESNGFIYEMMSNNGRIKYEYIIVNDPSNEMNIKAKDQILENREPFLIDGEMDADNDLLNTVKEEEGANVYLINQDLRNEDINNEDSKNESLAMSENHGDVEELKKYWYENIHTSKLTESEEKEILTQELFVSVLAQTVSKFKTYKSQFEEHPLNFPLKGFYYVFGFTVRDWKYAEKPFSFSNISDEVISFIQQTKKYPNV